jgi:hypothetical protein
MDMQAEQGAEQLLHLIANPLATRAGVRLQLSPDMATQKGGRGELVRAEELVRMFPNLQLCVVQAPLATGRRSGTDRERASYLRAFAADVFAAGVPAVLTVPPLDFHVAQAALTLFARALTDREPGVYPALLGGARATREEILRQRTDTPESAEEAAYDICLYVAGERPRA